MKTNLKKHILPTLLSFVILFAFSALLVHAQAGGTSSTGGAGDTSSTGGAGSTSSTGSTPPVSITINNPFNAAAGDGNVVTLFKTIIEFVVIPIGGVLCVLGFIYAGFLYVTAGGDPGGVKTAKNMLINATIGTALLLGAGAIATVIDATIKQLQG